MKLINIFGPPGSGKTTLAASVFTLLRQHQITADLVYEYAKDCCWDEAKKPIENQVLVFANQLHRIKRLEGKVDYAVVDSPLLNSLVYGDVAYSSFRRLVIECHNHYGSVNVWLPLGYYQQQFETVGRFHDHQQSLSIQNKLLATLTSVGVPLLSPKDLEVYLGLLIGRPELIKVNH